MGSFHSAFSFYFPCCFPSSSLRYIGVVVSRTRTPQFLSFDISIKEKMVLIKFGVFRHCAAIIKRYMCVVCAHSYILGVYAERGCSAE